MYQGIFGVNASSEAMAIQSYNKMAATMAGISMTGMDDNEATIQRVKDPLEQWSERWLMVFDNYDQADQFEGIRRFTPSGKCIPGFHT